MRLGRSAPSVVSQFEIRCSRRSALQPLELRRVHQTLHITPVMAAGIVDHVWIFEERSHGWRCRLDWQYPLSVRSLWLMGTGFLSIVYLICLSLFLCFQAMWICDGYYPENWSPKGIVIRLVLWSLPAVVLAGCWMMGARPCRRRSSILLLVGLFVLTLEVVWVDFDSVAHRQESSLLAIHLAVLVLAYSAFAGLRKWARVRLLVTRD